MEDGISLRELFDILKDHSVLIFVSIATGFILAGIYTFFIVTPMYESSTEVLVRHSSEDQSGLMTEQDINTSLQLIDTYEVIIGNEVTLTPVIEDLNLDMTVEELRQNISVGQVEESQVFSISVQDSNPVQAAGIANTIAEEFQNNISEMMNVNNVTVISQAFAPTSPASPNVGINLVIGLFLGLMTGVLFALVSAKGDRTVKSDEFTTNEMNWPILGRVAVIKKEDIEKKPVPNQLYHQEKRSHSKRV